MARDRAIAAAKQAELPPVKKRRGRPSGVNNRPEGERLGAATVDEVIAARFCVIDVCFQPRNRHKVQRFEEDQARSRMEEDAMNLAQYHLAKTRRQEQVETDKLQAQPGNVSMAHPFKVVQQFSKGWCARSDRAKRHAPAAAEAALRVDAENQFGRQISPGACWAVHFVLCA